MKYKISPERKTEKGNKNIVYNVGNQFVNNLVSFYYTPFCFEQTYALAVEYT